MPEISEKNINAFLHFGWLPRTDIPPPFPEEWIPIEATNNNPSLTEGANILREAVINQVMKKEVTVPLSGGFDSRAMLAIVHELGKDITAVTLGVPGTYDFEIGRLVAKQAGIRHEGINLNDIPLSTSALVSTAQKLGDWTNIIETFWSIMITEKYQSTPIISGFLGDFLAGSYSKVISPNWTESKIKFSKDNCVSRDIKLTKEDFLSELSLPIKSTNFSLTMYEELVYRVRHTCSLRPTAFKTDFGYIMPFKDERWINFILNCKPEFRFNQRYYQDMLLKNWPGFFSLPSKNYRGASINSSKIKKRLLAQKSRVLNKFGRTWPQVSNCIFGIDKMLNYTDFNNQIVHNPNFKSVFIENLSDLEKRDLTPWLDLKRINKNLQEKNHIDYAEGIMLLTLTNLEVNLKASE